MESKLNEPSTKEIVRALRCDGCDGACSECFFGFEEKDSIGYDTWGCRCGELDNAAADRLESQERAIAELKYQLELLSIGIPVQMKELTARAESAERERDAAVISLYDLMADGVCASCSGCNAPHSPENITYCEDWEYRGLLPQDGEGKK